ncbi:MAG: hypothetical protein JSS02_22700 [Planctomycetes bacterium]|nr:hypothetical protein [Planctomycetota bacterium]
MRHLFSAPLVSIRTAILLAVTACASTPGVAWPASEKIEAVKDKVYTLSPKHGPWMIKVATMWEEPDQRETKVLNALVYKLRKAGIPAYIHRQKQATEEIESVDRKGRARKRELTAQHAMVAVLAGNYESPDEKKAKQTLAYIQKKFDGKVTVEFDGRTEEIPLRTKTAFMTPNPLIPNDGSSKKVTDPLLLTLNSGTEHSLFENKGKFTLVVASFYGQSTVNQAEFSKMDEAILDKKKVTLDQAAKESWELMKTLRKLGFPAFVYHEQFRSIVTIGEFKSPNDPKMQELFERFRAKPDVDPKTGQMLTDQNGKPLLLPVNIQFDPKEQPVLIDKPTHAAGTAQLVMNGNFGPAKGKSKNRVGRGWMMDPVPEMMPVPRT